MTSYWACSAGAIHADFEMTMGIQDQSGRDSDQREKLKALKIRYGYFA